jgi:hypothetical protein
VRPGKIRVLKRADLASSEAATSRCPSKRRYLNVPTTSPAVRHKRAPVHRLGSFFANRAPGRLPLRPDLKGRLTAREAREERGKIVLSAVPSSHGPMTRIRYSSLSLFRTGIGFGWVRSRKAFRRSCGGRKPDADYMALSGGTATRTERSPGHAGAKFLGGDQKGTIAVKFRWRPTAQSAAEPCRSPSRRRG